MPYKSIHILTHNEVIETLKMAWALAKPELKYKDVQEFKLKDFEVLEQCIKDFFQETTKFNIETVSAGSLLKLLQAGESKRNRAIAIVSFYVLLKNDNLSERDKEAFEVQKAGKNVFSDYPKRVKILTKLKEVYFVSPIKKNQVKETPVRKKNSLKIWLIVVISLVILSLLAAKYISFSSEEAVFSENEVVWDIETCNVPSNLPCAITITYDLSKIRFRKAYIDVPGHGLIKLNKKKGKIDTLTLKKPIDTFYLLIDDKKYSKKIFLTTPKWIGKVNNVFIPYETLENNGRLHINDSILKHIKHAKEEFYVSYVKSGDFNYDLNNLMFEARIKNSKDEGGISCYDVSFDLNGIHNNILKGVSFNLLEPGCTNWARLQIGELSFNPDFYDLSHSGVNLNDWKVIKAKISDGKFVVYADGKVLYNIPFKEDLGKLQFIQVLFKGNGSLDYFKMYSSDNFLLFEDNF